MTHFLKWFKELNLFLGDNSKNWTWLKDLNSLFFKLDSKNWTYFDDSQTWSFFLELCHKEFFLKKKKWLKELDRNFWLKDMFFCMAQRKFFCMTQRIDFFVWPKELKPFSLNMTQRIEPFFFFAAKNWNFFLFAANDWVFFFKNFIDSKNWTFFFWYDSKKWNPKKKKKTQRVELFFNMTYRIEPLLFSLIWFKELNFVSKKETQKIEPFCFFQQWLKGLNSL